MQTKFVSLFFCNFDKFSKFGVKTNKIANGVIGIMARKTAINHNCLNNSERKHVPVSELLRYGRLGPRV